MIQDPIYKNVEFCDFCQKKNHECVFIFFFFPGVIVSTQGSLNSLRGLIRTEIKTSTALFK